MIIAKEVGEYLLTKDGGLTRRDIHGERRRGTHVERRTDIAATTRRVLGRVGRRRVVGGVATLGTAVGVTAVLAGLEAAGVYVGSILWFVAFLIYRRVPDVVFDADVDPKATVTRSTVPGMNDDVYARRLAIHTERNELREQKIEEKRKRREQKRKGNSRTF